jgi:hypothetical protein
MPIPHFTTKHWILFASSLIIIASLAIFSFGTFANPVNASTAHHDHEQDGTTPTTQSVTIPSTPTPLVNTPEPTPTATYKIIPRNSTYTPSKPLIEPIDPNRTYSISINPPFDGYTAVHQGTIFEVSGTTDLPVGVELNVMVTAGGTSPTKATIDYMSIDTTYSAKPISQHRHKTTMSGIIYVEPGHTKSNASTPTPNTWRFIVDSSPFLPNEYVIQITSNGYSTESIVCILEELPTGVS